LIDDKIRNIILIPNEFGKNKPIWDQYKGKVTFFDFFVNKKIFFFPEEGVSLFSKQNQRPC
jgi:hypothetical protein